MRPVQLSPVETYFWRFEEDLQAFRVGILVRVDGCIEAEFLAEALSYLQKRHPKLRAKIIDGRDGRTRYAFPEPTPPIPFEILDYPEAEFPWREETDRLLKVSFPNEGPLAGLVVLRDRARRCCQLILTATHAFTDGQSAIMLVNDLLSGYAAAESELNLPGEALPMVSAWRVRRAPSWAARRFLVSRYRRLRRTMGSCGQTSLPIVENVPSLSQWVLWDFSREETLRLVRRCRREQTSLNAAMMAAAFCGIMDCLSISQAAFRWQIPFSIREGLISSKPVTVQDLGCFASNMNGLLRVESDPDFWDTARKAHREVQGFVQQGGPFFAYNVASYLYRLSTEFRRLVGLPPRRLALIDDDRVTLLSTNYGVVNLQDAYGSLRPRNCTLIFRNDKAGPSLVMEALVLGHQLNIGFAADSLDPAFWKQLQAAVRGRLEAAASEAGPDAPPPKASAAVSAE